MLTFEIVCFIASLYILCISVGLRIHRLWVHGCYKVNKLVELLFAIISARTLEAPILAWISDHGCHSYTDILGKVPHTPLKYYLLEKTRMSLRQKGN